MSLVTIAAIFFLLMDPLGNLPAYLGMVEGIPPARRRIIVLREMSIALLVIVLFYFIGEFVLSTLKISEPAVRITSGVILFLIALKILFTSTDSLRANLPKGEPLVTPLAIPLIAGPAVIATVMLFAVSEPTQLPMLLGIFIAWTGATLILFFATPINNLLGQSGLNAFERMMGLVLIMLAIQRALEGVQAFIPLYCQ